MNSGVITKIEYCIFPTVSFTELEIIPYSGKVFEDIKKDDGGNEYSDCTIDFKIAKSETAKDTILKSIVNRKGKYRINDANGVVYVVGDDTYPARLTYTRNLDGQPGSFNGYNCVITCKTTNGITISS